MLPNGLHFNVWPEKVGIGEHQLKLKSFVIQELYEF